MSRRVSSVVACKILISGFLIFISTIRSARPFESLATHLSILKECLKGAMLRVWIYNE